MRIAITGTPGTGKSTVSRMLGEALGYRVIDLNKLVIEECKKGYDRKRKTYIADIACLSRHVRRSGLDYVLDSHVSHLLSNSLIDIVIVLRCNPKVLDRRLSRNGWSRAKIEENVEAELINIISWEARKRHRKVFDVDTSKKNPDNTAKTVISVIRGRSASLRKPIDWLR